jgi:DNA repair protein RecO (recombination protein O)
MIVKTEAVILRSRKFRETSKILTLHTREHGKLSVIAKGACDRRAKFGSALDSMNYVVAVIYKKENRDLHLLTQCDLIKSFNKLSEDMDRMAAALSIIELVEVVTRAEDESKALFDMVVQTLETVNTATKNALNVLYFFEMRLSEILGFRPNFHQCSSCGALVGQVSDGTKEGELHLSSGGVRCGKCSHARIGHGIISAAGLRILQELQKVSHGEAVTKMTLSSQLRDEVHTALRQHLQTHIGGLHRLKADAVFSAIM